MSSYLLAFIGTAPPKAIHRKRSTAKHPMQKMMRIGKRSEWASRSHMSPPTEAWGFIRRAPIYRG
jgi:hypothetical protein